MVKAKPNQKFHVDKLSTALDKLDQLESKPKEELTLRESIYFLRGKLNSALRKGYSYEDLSEILAEQEILVSAATLKLYLTESSKKSASRKKRSKSSPKSSPAASINVTDNEEELETSNSEDEINSMKDSTDSERAVNLNSVTRIKSSRATGEKSSKAKTKVLSGSDDDLSDEFNNF